MDPSSAPPLLAPSSAPASLAPSPWAGANLHGRKLGASHSGAELGAVNAGAKLGAVDAGAEHAVSGTVNDVRRQADSNSRRPRENLGQTTTDEPGLVKKNFVAK